MNASYLRTEYLDKPIGIDIIEPRFYWNCKEGKKQTAYQIICTRNGNEIWNSGKVISDSMTHIKYEGMKLESRDVIEWKVRIWDENDQVGNFTESTFEMGLLKKEDWQAKWISGNYKPKRHVRYPVDCFHKRFNIEKEIEKARLYITACGLYKAKINGKRVGEFILAPGSTDYRHKIHYQTYKVGNLNQGINVIEIDLADGWYRGSVGAYGVTNVYGRETKLFCQLEVTYADGNRETIVSDRKFDWSNNGPLRFADLQDGEVYDANYTPTYKNKAKEVKYKVIPTSANNVIPKEQERFTPKLIKSPSGKKILDFGQNIAGYIEFKCNTKKCEKINLKFGETLDENGEFTQKNFQIKKTVKEMNIIDKSLLIIGKENKIKKELQNTPKQEITYISNGKENTYKTEFAIFGFRYVLVESDVDINPQDFSAIAVYSNMKETGKFICSNDKINKLFNNTLWSMKGNFLDVPTDCPTRERLGWTGDAQIFFETGAYMMDISSFFRKWLDDMHIAQEKSGKITAVVPYSDMNMMYKTSGNSVGWADAVVLIPYRFWKIYGDSELLEEYYSMMHRYAMFMIKKTGHKKRKQRKNNPYNKYVYEKGFHFGEWLEPEEFREKEEGGTSMTKINRTEECTAYLHYVMKHMREISGYLDKNEDYKLFKEYEEGSKKAYNYLFLKEIPDTDRQAKLVRPLAFDIVSNDKRKDLESRLFEAVENRDYKVGTGFLSTPFLLETLTEAGRADLAYKVLENEEAPGWLYEIKSGATTIWEDWEGKASLNHYSPGAVCKWFFDTICGIKILEKNKFEISPIPGGTLKEAKAEYLSLYGLIKSEWKVIEDKYMFKFSIPPNTLANVVLGGKSFEIEAGEYEYTFNIKDID